MLRVDFQKIEKAEAVHHESFSVVRIRNGENTVTLFLDNGNQERAHLIAELINAAVKK